MTNSSLKNPLHNCSRVHRIGFFHILMGFFHQNIASKPRAQSKKFGKKNQLNIFSSKKWTKLTVLNNTPLLWLFQFHMTHVRKCSVCGDSSLFMYSVNFHFFRIICDFQSNGDSWVIKKHVDLNFFSVGTMIIFCKKYLLCYNFKSKICTVKVS